MAAFKNYFAWTALVHVNLNLHEPCIGLHKPLGIFSTEWIILQILILFHAILSLYETW